VATCRVTCQHRLSSTRPDESLSRRLAEIVNPMPIRPGVQVLEIGCGREPLRAVAARLGTGQILAVE
jgi:cyclopropane fatty-acyl-phospholipid synthase-like methyltransferase